MRDKDVLIVIPARSSSKRLPEKYKAEVYRKQAMLEVVYNRCLRTGFRVVVAAGDGEIHEWCKHRSIYSKYFPEIEEGDVLGRLEVIREGRPKNSVMVRVTGDCPLVCPDLIQAVVSMVSASMQQTCIPAFGSLMIQAEKCVWGFPDGLDVEAFPADFIWELVHLFDPDPKEREHITLGMKTRYPLVTYTPGWNMVPPELPKLSVDDPEDLDRVRKVFQFMGGTKFTFRELLPVLRAMKKGEE